MKERQQQRNAGLRDGLSGLVLGLISLFATISLMVGGFYLAAILKNLPEIEELETLVGPGGRLYQQNIYYDHTGQILIPGSNGSQGDSIDLVDLYSGQIEEETGGFSTYLSALMAVDSPIEDESLLNESTTTERLISGLLLRGEPQSSFRDLRLRLLVAIANNRYGKANLDNWYINSVDFTHGVIGVEAAAEYYFNKSFLELDSGEALILSVITLEPSVNPIDSPDIFAASLKNAEAQLLGQRLVDEELLEQADRALVTSQRRPLKEDPGMPAFISAVKGQFSGEAVVATAERGGLKVITSLDAVLQTRLTCALIKILNEASIRPECEKAISEISTPLPDVMASRDLIINFVVMDPANGQVLAMLGDYSTAGGEQDYLKPHATASLVTPFIYLTGFLQGMSPATLVWDTPTGLSEANLEYYSESHLYRGPMSVRTALSGDHLAPAAKLLAGIGMDPVKYLMSGFGLTLYASEGIPYTSGIADSLSIAQAYGTLANMGIRAGNTTQSQSGGLSPTFILRAIDRDGTVIFEKNEPKKQSLVSPELAFLVNDILGSELDGNLKYRGSVKTSLSLDGADYWHVAYTPEYVFVLYMGYPEPVGQTGLNELGIDWALTRIVDDALRSESGFDGWMVPDGVTRQMVCVPSGMVPGKACPQTRLEYFLDGTEPSDIDTLFQEYQIDSETGRLATVFTDPARITQQTFFSPPEEELVWARSAGIPLPPGNYSVLTNKGVYDSTTVIEPANFKSVRGLITLSGTIEPAEFISYRLDLGAGLAPTQWLQVGDEVTELPQGKMLGTLETTKFENGLYTIRIQVLRQGNFADNSYVVILISNPIADS
jgi:membrane peptidoglycan carboxypeptidase